MAVMLLMFHIVANLVNLNMLLSPLIIPLLLTNQPQHTNLPPSIIPHLLLIMPKSM